MNRWLFAIAVAGIVQSNLSLAQPLPGGPGADPYTGQTRYNVRGMDFDLWCQQTQRYSVERCAGRKVEDIKAFEDYRTAVERYELDYLRQVERNEQLRARTARDPFQNVQGKQDGLP